MLMTEGKSEIRISKPETSSKGRKWKWANGDGRLFVFFAFLDLSHLFRISDFGFRISFLNGHLSRFTMHLTQMLGSQRAPVLFVGIRPGFLLHCGDGFLDLGQSVAPPDLNGLFCCPVLLSQLFLGHFSTIASQRGGLEL